jgi:G:T-mismatch repair DNA endonuclease (very short patch repair protein)
MARRRKKVTKKVSTGKTSIETKVAKILTSMNVPFQEQVTIDKYTVDFLVAEKYVVECYGDFWHCNPHQYTSSYFNRGKKKTADEIWKRDTERKTVLENMGYKFLCLWETDIKNNPTIVRSKLKKSIPKD